MSDEKEIHLTVEELQDIKNDERFKVKTTETLKYLREKVIDVSTLKTNVSTLQSDSSKHWRLILLILASIGSTIIWVAGK